MKQDLVGNAATQIALIVGDDDEAVRLIFLSTLNRYPSSSECETFKTYLDGKTRGAAFKPSATGDLGHTNSTEFSWSH
ncbi:MAG: hypothetical protein U0892_06500 [Pirellulales bacterium]